MKKILAISFIAMSAVSAANANIASQAYVDDRTGTLTNLSTDAKTNLVAAINEVDSHADANANAISGINTTIGTLPEGQTSVIGYIGSVESAANAGVADLDKTAEEVRNSQTGQFVKGISEENGLVSATFGAIEEGTTNGTIKVDGTDVAVHGLGSAAYTASTAYDAAGAAADVQTAINTTIGTLPEGQTTVTGYIASVANTANTTVADLDLTAEETGTGNVIVSVTQTDGQVAASKGYAINTVNTATGGGNVISGISVNGTNPNQLDVTTITAIPKPDGNCTDCVLHFNGTAYSWEEITRVTPAQQGSGQQG